MQKKENEMSLLDAEVQAREDRFVWGGDAVGHYSEMLNIEPPLSEPEMEAITGFLNGTEPVGMEQHELRYSIVMARTSVNSCIERGQTPINEELARHVTLWGLFNVCKKHGPPSKD